MKKIAVVLCTIMLVFGITGSVNAALISLTLGEYSSPYHSDGQYYDQYLVGTFNYDLTGQTIVSASISGHWGNSSASTTAHNLLFADTLEVADTQNYSPSPYNNSNVPWFFGFTDFTVLEDGTVDFFTVQTSEYVVQLGETTLNIETCASAVPEPATMLLLGSGLVGLAGLRRKFRKK